MLTKNNELKENAKETLQSGKNTAKALINDEVKDGWHSTIDNARDTFESAKDIASQTVGNAKDKVQDWQEQAGQFIKSHPWKSTAIALFGGWAISKLFGRK